MSKDFDIHEWHLYQANLNLLTEEENEFDEPINVSDKWNVKELGVGDVITPNMWDEDKIKMDNSLHQGLYHYFKYPFEIINSSNNGRVIDIMFNGTTKMENRLVSFFNKYLKPQYQITTSLNESDDFDDEINVSDKWNLSSEDEELLSYYDGEWELTDEGLVIKDDLDLRGTNIQSLGSLKSINGGLDLFDSEIKSLGNLQYVGSWLNLRGTKIESLGNLEIVEGNLHLRDTPLARKYTEKEIRQMVDIGGGIYGFSESIDESDDDFDDEINVSDMWNEINLWDGDIITPDMWADDIDDYEGYVNYISGGKLKSFKDKNWTLKYLGDIYFELKSSSSVSAVLDIVEIQKLLKPHYKLTPP